MNRNDQLFEEAFRLLGFTFTRIDPSRLEEWVGLGLTMTQVRVLFILRLEEGASAGHLADRLNVTPSTLTRIMDRLVGHDLVRREVHPEDRRQVCHFLTEKGAQRVEELERTGRARFREILGHLSPEQLERLVAALGDLYRAIEASERPVAPTRPGEA